MTFNVLIDKIEVRSIKDGDKPRYIVKGIGIVANKKDIYEYTKKADGTYKTLKSMFTSNCIKSIKEQSKHKKLFIDSQHELASNANIKSMLKDKLTPDEKKQLDVMLKTKMLPLAKLNDIEIEDDAIKLDTELNPAFRDVDEVHKRYFDATWYSLEHKFLNGISINFGEFKYIVDENGDTVIDDVDVLGFSYVDGAAHHENSIYEVAIRAIKERINIREGSTMTEETEKLEAEKKQFEEEKKQFETEKAEAAKQKEEADKKADIEKQAAEQKRIEAELLQKNEELKKAHEEKEKMQAELTSVKGQVPHTPPPSAPGSGNPTQAQSEDPKFYQDQLKEISAAHDKTIETISKGQKPLVDESLSGFGKLINLQAQSRNYAAKAHNYTADMDPSSVANIEELRLLDKSDSDIVAVRKT